MTYSISKYKFYIALLLCFVQVAGIDVFAQEAKIEGLESIKPDTIITEPLHSDSLVVDSIAVINAENQEKLDSMTSRVTVIPTDSIPPLELPSVPLFIPNPTRATWLAVVFPGGGQIYNRKYWKLPIFYGGFVGCAYALSWNGTMYKDYSQAYLDIMDGDPNTNSYYDFIAPGTIIDETTDTRYSAIMKSRKDYYRRYRDISVFAFIAVYALSIIDAYVDAELSNFDISPDLSFRFSPTFISGANGKSLGYKGGAIGLQCSITF